MNEPVDQSSFPGQQEGERILYVIKSHWTREAAFALKAILAYAGVFAIRFLTNAILPLSEEIIIKGYLILGLGLALALLWNHLRCFNSRSYITERRIVRFEGPIPAFQTKRALFWADVTKVRTFSSSWILQLMKVGHLEVIPNFAAEGQNILVHHVYYFEDLGGYMEKIVYMLRTDPKAITQLREFIPKPKGKRYQ